LQIDRDKLPDRLVGLPLEEWVPALAERAKTQSRLLNGHAHHDTNPWNWDGLRVAAELWRQGVSQFGVVAFDSGAFIASIAALSRYIAEPIPCFIEALVLTPGGETWNDLPGRMYVQAGPFFSTEEAKPISDALTQLARKRAEYQAERWNAGLNLGFEYRPDWKALELRGVTEANLSREIVDAIKANSPDPLGVWRQIPSLDADPNDGNFARVFRNATMVSDDAVARVPRTTEFYLSSPDFTRLAGDKAHYMYVGKTSGVEADRAGLLDRMKDAGFPRFCAIPQRNLDTPERAEDFERVLGLLVKRDIPTLLGTELNALGQWWSVDFSASPFAEKREWLEREWNSVIEESNRH
jgi:hypothetical protein